MRFQEDTVLKWMSLIREHPDAIECFWPSQVQSKTWLCETIGEYLAQEGSTGWYEPQTAIIFGSWYGVLADMLEIPKTVCVDIEEKYLAWFNTPDLAWPHKSFHVANKHYATVQCSLDDYIYSEDLPNPDIVINTICEHIDQPTYDKWFNNIPKGTYFVIQGNNDFSHKDHIRANNSLDEFVNNNVRNFKLEPVYQGTLQYEGPWNHTDNCPTHYTRFMAIGRKDVPVQEDHFRDHGNIK